MRVLLIGSGGREHALAWKIAQSPKVEEVICAPGNAGMMSEPKVKCLDISAEDVEAIVGYASEHKPDLVVVGPEMPLVLGLADRLSQQGILTLGPFQKGAMLEGSKVFAKKMMQRCQIPTAEFEVFDQMDAAMKFVNERGGRWVIKADGLAAGKGVIPCESVAEAEAALKMFLVDKAFSEAGRRVVVESFLDGEEASCIALTDGREIQLLASSQDHKRVFDQDKGPNTGGMGAYSPAPVLDASLEEQVVEQVFKPLLEGLKEDGIDFRGFIYAGLMIDSNGPKVLEFNVRLGDPETQPLMIRLKSDLVPALVAAASGDLSGVSLEWDQRPSVCVVMASGGYPGSYQKGKPVIGLEQASKMDDVVVFHAGTKMQAEQVVTAGGRVLGVCALGDDIKNAVDNAYAAAQVIDFDGVHYRKDIAYRALKRLK
jgi:phosphoribosylamine--glycine ligase